MGAKSLGMSLPESGEEAEAAAATLAFAADVEDEPSAPKENGASDPQQNGSEDQELDDVRLCHAALF